MIKARRSPDAAEYESLRDGFLLCRTLGHSWDEISARHVDQFHLRCTRCGTERTDTIDYNTGAVAGRRYDYADGYQINEAVTRSELRIEWMRRREHRTITNTKRRTA